MANVCIIPATQVSARIVMQLLAPAKADVNRKSARNATAPATVRFAAADRARTVMQLPANAKAAASRKIARPVTAMATA
jgi:hypothetical protein